MLVTIAKIYGHVNDTVRVTYRGILTTAIIIVQSSQPTFLMMAMRAYIRMVSKEQPANPMIHAATTRPGPRFTSGGESSMYGSIVVEY